MMGFKSISEKFANLNRSVLSIYPVVVIVSIPALIIVNTLWNLKSFNRDANFIIRHHAVSIADSLKPSVKSSLDDEVKLRELLLATQESSEDILFISIIKDLNGEFSTFAKSSASELENIETGLNEFAKGLGKPTAGLIYDPYSKKEVWNVVVPLLETDFGDYYMRLVLDTKSITEILSRTIRDSTIILIILVVVTVFLLINHFIFYLRSQKTRQLEELDKLKDEFISIAAHELKAPITALIGYLELLKGKISPNEVEKIKPDLELLNSLINDLNDLINELLDVSRIEQGRIQIETKEVDINEIIDKVVKTILPEAGQKGLRINFTKVELPFLKTDPDRVRQILMNLISNSLKYTLQGEISVNAVKEKDFVKINIKDTGIGIPGEEISKLFSKFHRVKDRKTAEVRGTGLGLWITKQIVELLGGKIWVESIYGTGTSVTFTLPIISI